MANGAIRIHVFFLILHGHRQLCSCDHAVDYANQRIGWMRALTLSLNAQPFKHWFESVEFRDQDHLEHLTPYDSVAPISLTSTNKYLKHMYPDQNIRGWGQLFNPIHTRFWPAQSVGAVDYNDCIFTEE